MLAFSKSVLQRLDKPAQPLALHRVRLPPLSSRDAAATPCSRSRARAILTRWQRRAGVEALVVNHIQLLLKTCLICMTLTGASLARGLQAQALLPVRLATHAASPTHRGGARVAGLTDALWVARRTTSFQRTHTACRLRWPRLFASWTPRLPSSALVARLSTIGRVACGVTIFAAIDQLPPGRTRHHGEWHRREY